MAVSPAAAGHDPFAFFSHSMIDHVEELAALLRKNGVRVSTAEVIDASRALARIGFDQRARVHAALSVSLIKRAQDAAIFDELFELYFAGTRGLGEANESLAALARDAQLTEAAARQLALAAASLSAVARVGLGVSAPELAQLVRAAGVDLDLERLATPLQVGFFAYRILDALDAGGAEAELRALIERMVDQREVTEAAAELLRARIATNFAALRRAVRDYVDAEFRKRNLDFMQDLATRALSEKPLSQLNEAEVAALRHEVRRLALIFRSKLSRRRRHRKRGRLDLGRTLRHSLAAGGVPFSLYRRERERHKPRLLILCDVSDSVRNVSRFMLQLTYLLAEAFDRVDAFAFVAELGELTELFRRHDLDRAIELVVSGRALNVFANSNYGRALGEFASRHLSKVTPRTTVMIIGDGRNNYNDARAEVLATIRRRARRVIWLNPESPAAWGFGDSAMNEYRQHCDEVAVAHNLESLRQIIDRLISAPAPLRGRWGRSPQVSGAQRSGEGG